MVEVEWSTISFWLDRPLKLNLINASPVMGVWCASHWDIQSHRKSEVATFLWPPRRLPCTAQKNTTFSRSLRRSNTKAQVQFLREVPISVRRGYIFITELLQRDMNLLYLTNGTKDRILGPNEKVRKNQEVGDWEIERCARSMRSKSESLQWHWQRHEFRFTFSSWSHNISSQFSNRGHLYRLHSITNTSQWRSVFLPSRVLPSTQMPSPPSILNRLQRASQTSKFSIGLSSCMMATSLSLGEDSILSLASQRRDWPLDIFLFQAKRPCICHPRYQDSRSNS